jgi:hypothetical protein
MAEMPTRDVAMRLALTSIRANELLGKTSISTHYLLIWVAIER